jgi:hypothetical protein
MNRLSRMAGADFFVVNRPHPANFYAAPPPGEMNKPEERLAREGVPQADTAPRSPR